MAHAQVAHAEAEGQAEDAQAAKIGGKKGRPPAQYGHPLHCCRLPVDTDRYADRCTGPLRRCAAAATGARGWWHRAVLHFFAVCTFAKHSKKGALGLG